MRSPRILSIRVAGVLLGLAGLASCATLNRDGVMAAVGGGGLSVRQGAPLVISLAADSTAGYGWVLTSDPGKAVWLVGGPDFAPEPVPAGVMGVGGTTTYRFRALDPGAVKLDFAYRPILEKDAPAARVVSYDVTVTSGGWMNWF